MTDSEPHTRAGWVVRLSLATALVGIASGVAGLSVSLLLRVIEEVVYGYDDAMLLAGLPKTAPWIRVVALLVAGIIGGVGWWLLRRRKSPIVSVEKAVAGTRMPWISSLVNAGLQIVIVGLGASIGREVAPRELGALLSGWISDRLGLSVRERRILVACGAAAGLAAVYDVPLAGAVFAVEILLVEVRFATVLPALASSAIAALVARLVVPPGPVYHLPTVHLSASLVIWSILAGPVLGFAATGFITLAGKAQALRPTSWGILIVMPVVFTAVGVLSLWLPEVLGNGRMVVQTAFTVGASLGVVALLTLAKAATTVGTIGAGAAGGTLTPSLAVGAVLGATAGGAWALLWPGTSVVACAFIGGAAFLAASMRAPLTALLLALEFTGDGWSILIPALLAIGGSVLVPFLLDRRALRGVT